jgi:hypothetical protein
MLFKSPVWSDAAGSLAGLTAMRSRSGAMLRRRNSPVHPTSLATSVHRAALQFCTLRWATVLTPGHRAGWQRYASQIAYPSRLAGSIQLSGLQHYIRSNVPRVKYRLPIIDTAPPIANLGEPPSIGEVIVSWAFPGIIAYFDEAQEWCGQLGAYLFLYSTRPVSPVLQRRRVPLHPATDTVAGTHPPQLSPAASFFDYGPPSANRVWCGFRISLADGRLSPITITGPHQLIE